MSWMQIKLTYNGKSLVQQLSDCTVYPCVLYLLYLELPSAVFLIIACLAIRYKLYILHNK